MGDVLPLASVDRASNSVHKHPLLRPTRLVHLRTQPMHHRVNTTIIRQVVVTLRRLRNLLLTTETPCKDRERHLKPTCNRLIHHRLSLLIHPSHPKLPNGDLPIYSTATWSLARARTVKSVLRLGASPRDMRRAGRASAKSLLASASCCATTPSTLPNCRRKSMC
jgi:hypothetical protein